MPHSTSLIATIVVGLVLAFGFGFVARRLHLPPLVGYWRPVRGRARLGADPAKWRRHAVVVGYGRVGGPIGRALSEQGLPFIIVESNRWRAEELRAQGLPIVWGDAAAPGVLEAAHVEHALLLVIATPDPFQGRRILELARRVNPRIDTVVRTHWEGELSYLERQGVGMAVMGERELALSMMNYALRSLGLSETRARVVVQGFRTSFQVPDHKTDSR